MCADLINSKFQDYSLLDAGCRDMTLKPLLNGCKEYYGGDLVETDGVLECNLEKPLLFEDNSFDVVVALDVLEHLNDPHGAFQELLRVAKRSLIISLPNMYYIKFRLNFLLGNGISGKYRFPADPIVDRHRWIMSFSEIEDFVEKNAGKFPFHQKIITPIRGRTKFVSSPIEKFLAKQKPDLFAYGALFEITVDR